MSRLFPHPVLSFALVFLWLMLTRFSLGYLILGTVLSLVAGWAYSALHSAKPRIRRWSAIPRLIGTLFLDIIRSNVAVTRLLLTEGRSGRQSAFIRVPLQITSGNSLAVLAIILFGKSAVAYGILRVSGQDHGTALSISATTARRSIGASVSGSKPSIARSPPSMAAGGVTSSRFSIRIPWLPSR